MIKKAISVKILYANARCILVLDSICLCKHNYEQGKIVGRILFSLGNVFCSYENIANIKGRNMQAVNYFVLFKARAINKVHIMTHSYINTKNISQQSFRYI